MRIVLPLPACADQRNLNVIVAAADCRGPGYTGKHGRASRMHLRRQRHRRLTKLCESTRAMKSLRPSIFNGYYHWQLPHD